MWAGGRAGEEDDHSSDEPSRVSTDRVTGLACRASCAQVHPHEHGGEVQQLWWLVVLVLGGGGVWRGGSAGRMLVSVSAGWLAVWVRVVRVLGVLGRAFFLLLPPAGACMQEIGHR